ncbi:MAG TPA: MFS transporter [Actinomycetes bacterium]|nr:MFS transporter [Actinomycetes bacterium]
MRLRVIVLVYVALFVAELSWSGVTPLIPSYVKQYDLTDFQGGMVLSVASLGILVISIPAGMVTKRINPRALTLGSMAVIAVAGYGMALAPGYWAIILARLIFGLGFGTLYVSMTAWLDDAAGGESARVLALTTSIVGVAATISPAYAGWVADNYGLSAPFVGLAAITTVLFILLLFERSGTGLRKEAAPPVRDLARAVTSDPGLSAMILLTIAAAVVWMTTDLLVPLRLDDGGYDVAGIGFVFAVSAVVFVLASAITARYANRWTRMRFAAWWTLALAVVTAVPAIFVGIPATLVFLMGASVTTGVIVALTYPFGLLAVQRGAVTVAVMSALANIIWALSGMLGPTVGGAFAEWAGDKVAFGVLALVSAVVVPVLLRYASAERRAATR